MPPFGQSFGQGTGKSSQTGQWFVVTSWRMFTYVRSAVVTVVLAEGAEKILVLHHQPSWHTLLTVHTGNVHKLALVGVLIDVASKFTNPLTSKLLIGTPNFKLSHFTWNLVVLEKAVCFPANWTNLTFLVSLGNARRAKVMPTGCQLRVT